MSDEFEVTAGPGRVRIRGLSRTLRSLEKAGADSTDMRDLMQALGQIVVDAARTPDASGRLSGTVRAGRGKTKAVVRAGGARAPYAGVIPTDGPPATSPHNRSSPTRSPSSAPTSSATSTEASRTYSAKTG